ncbi:phosphopantetheine-binding protein [Brochothrix thermosphacta]|nr:phosphopantetheine-binding protein [Brochothrix thermosphacta]WKK70254.1 phosphopantetheine-binding protein [Brochothrix thermosphacta]
MLEDNFDVKVESLTTNILELDNFDSLNVIELLGLFEEMNINVGLEDIMERESLSELELLINE